MKDQNLNGKDIQNFQKYQGGKMEILTLPISSTSFLHISSWHVQLAHGSVPDVASGLHQQGQSQTAKLSPSGEAYKDVLN